MLDQRTRDELLDHGPGWSCLTSIAGQTSLVILVDTPAQVAALRGRREAALQTQLDVREEGAAFCLAVDFQVRPAALALALLDPADSAARDRWAALEHQTTLPVYFFMLGQYDSPVLELRLNWPTAEGRKIPAQLAAAQRLRPRPPGSFAAVQAAIVQEHRTLPPLDVLKRAFDVPPTRAPLQASYSSPLGISWGDIPNGPQIDMGSLSGGIADLPDPSEIAYARWSVCPPDLLATLRTMTKKAWRGILALVPPGKLFRYVWPKDGDPLTGLRQVVAVEQQHDRVVPWNLVAAFYAAAQCLHAQLPPDEWGRVVVPFIGPTYLLELAPEISPLLAGKEVERMVRTWRATESGFPGNPYDRSRFCWTLGRLAWETPPTVPTTVLTASMAAAYCARQRGPWKVALPGSGSVRTADATTNSAIALWHMWASLQQSPQHRPTAEIVDHLLPGRLAEPPGDAIIEEGAAVVVGEVPVPEPSDPAWVRGLTWTMLEEARDQAIYAPTGPLRLPVRPRTLLWAWGLREIRVWAEPAGLWVALTVEGGRVTQIFWWEPEFDFLQQHCVWVPHWTKDALEAWCASLWRDLRVEGPPAFPEEKPAPAPRATPHPRTRTQTTPRLDLPRARGPAQAWNLRGQRRQWGHRADHAIAQRQAHASTPHRRVVLYAAECRAVALLAAWPDLAKLAPAGPALARQRLTEWAMRRQQALLRHQKWGLVRDREEAVWWEVMLRAAQTVLQALEKEPALALPERCQVVDTVLAQAQDIHPATADRHEDAHTWWQRGRQALAEAEDEGVEEVLAAALSQLERQREEALARAVECNLPPPVAGYTIVNPPPPAGQVRREPRVVRARGLLTLYAALFWEEDASAPPVDKSTTL